MDATYRADLMQLNELNFGRFDAEVDRRITQLDAKWSHIWQEFDAKFEKRFAQLDANWEQRWSELDAKLRLEFHSELGSLRAELHRGLPALETKLIRWMFLFWAGTLVPLAGLILALTIGG